MNFDTFAVDRYLQFRTRSSALKFPLQALRVPFGLLKVAEHVLRAVVPQYSLAKAQTQRHIVFQRFQRTWRLSRTREERMGPRPEIAMTISAIVSLKPVPQRISANHMPIQRDLPFKDGVGVRGLRESDPTFMADSGAKVRGVAQVPGNVVSVYLQASAAGILPHLITAHGEPERLLRT